MECLCLRYSFVVNNIPWQEVSNHSYLIERALEFYLSLSDYLKNANSEDAEDLTWTNPNNVWN